MSLRGVKVAVGRTVGEKGKNRRNLLGKKKKKKRLKRDYEGDEEELGKMLVKAGRSVWETEEFGRVSMKRKGRGVTKD